MPAPTPQGRLADLASMRRHVQQLDVDVKRLWKRVPDTVETQGEISGSSDGNPPTTGATQGTGAYFRLTTEFYRTKSGATGVEIEYNGSSWVDVTGTSVALKGDLFTGYRFSGTTSRVKAVYLNNAWFVEGDGMHLAQGTISGTTVTLTGGGSVTVTEVLGDVDDGSKVWVGWDEVQQIWDNVSAQCAVPGQLDFSQTFFSGNIASFG